MMHRWRLVAALVGLVVFVAACGDAAADARAKINEQVEGLDVDQVLEDLRDCEKLSETFVGLVETGADAVDQLAETAEGRVPETEIRDMVDRVSANRFFEIAEQIGCSQLQSRIAIVDQVSEIDPDSPEGSEFLEEILRQLEATS